MFPMGKKLAAILLTLFVGVGGAQAADRHWNNAAGGAWNVAANWSPAIVPTFGDSAFIELAGTYDVSITANHTVTNLTINNPTATLRGPGTGSILSLNILGAATLTDGTIDIHPDSNLTIASTGIFHFNGGTLLNEPPFINQGDLSFGPATNQSGTIQLRGQGTSSTISGDIPPNVTVELQNGTIFWDSGRTNYGTLNFDATPGVGFDGPALQVADSFSIINEGTVNFVDSAGGTSMPRIESQFINNGVFNVMDGANSCRLHKANAQHVNNGTINFPNVGAELDISGPLGSTSSLLNNGSVNVNSNFARLRVMDGATFINADGATISISGGGVFRTIAGGTLEYNGGTITGSPLIQDGDLKFGAGPATWSGTIQIQFGTLTNLIGNIPSGVTVNADSSLVTWDQGGTNFGIFNFNSGTVRLLVPDLSPVINEGTIGVIAGTALIEAMLINNGDINVTAVASANALTKTGAHHENNGTINVTGSGKFQLTQASGTSRLTNNGTINVNGTDAWLRVLNGATLATEDGSGITVAAGFGRGFHFETGSTFEFNGGTLTGSPHIINAQLMLPTVLATRSGTVLARGTSSTLTGDIPSGVEVLVKGNTGGTDTLTATAPVTIMGALTLDGIPMGGGGSVNATFKQIMGTLTNSPSGIIQSIGGSPFTNASTIEAELNNLGTVNVVDRHLHLNKSGASHNNSGTINLAAGKILTVTNSEFHESGTTITGGGTLALEGSTFFGTGTVGANVTLTNAAVLNAGASPATTTGILNITGNLTVNTGTTIRAAINGPVAGTGYDQVNVTGSAALSGIMNMIYAGDDAPCQAETYTVLTRVSGSGCFGGGSVNITGLSNSLNGFALSHNSCTGNQLVLSTVVEADCNDSCRDDALDISEGFSEDCNWSGGGVNGIPDECDIAACAGNPLCGDCNLNLVPDGCDLSACAGDPACDDCNGNLTPDSCDLAQCSGNNACEDCNANAIPDGCDIASCSGDPACADCNANFEPDGCELARASATDCDLNTILDECDIADCAGDPACGDCNANELPDGCDIAAETSQDCQPNAIPDECDIADCAGDPLCADCDLNLIPDGCDLSACAGEPACSDCNGNLALDGCEVSGGSAPDCNANAIPDECDIGTISADCQLNLIPDECDIAACAGDPACGDCNFNLVPDGCDTATCAPGDYFCQDCNDNGVMDECDVIGGAADIDGNLVPDHCYPSASSDPGLKTRFISFTIPSPPPTLQVRSALRVILVSLHHVDPPYTGGASVPFTSFEGQMRWVGPPTQYVESSSNATQFYASSLQCAPHYQDWSTVGLLHVTGSAVAPSSVYEVENVAASCLGIEASCTAVSARLTVSTTRWGDVEAPYNPPSATIQPDLGDVSALVNKFRGAAGAPIKARALLAGDDAFGNIGTLGVDFGFGHISACVDAFRGRPYPFTISSCP